MYIERVPNRNSPPAVLLRESYREGGKVRKRTIANLSDVPDHIIEGFRAVLKGDSVPRGEAIVDPKKSLVLSDARAHGAVAAIMTTIRRLGLDRTICGKRCRERDVVLAMIADRLLHGDSKLSTARHCRTETASSTLGAELGVEDLDEHECYRAMDWLLERQPAVEKRLAARHLDAGGLVFYDLSSSYFEGHTCPLARHGYSRDKRGDLPQVNYGLYCAPDGAPVAVDVLPGNENDRKAFVGAVQRVRDEFGLEEAVFVGDRGMISGTFIDEALRDMDGAEWITAVGNATIARLARESHIQIGVFDQQELATLTHADFPGERLIACRNPLLAEERRRKRDELLDATDELLAKVKQRVDRKSRPLRGADAIGLAVGKVVNKKKVAKHYSIDIADDAFTFERDQESIGREAALDGVYVIRTSLGGERMSEHEVVENYKRLALVESAFHALKSVDIKVRPIHHRLEDRVRAHIFICMLAYYVEHAMRAALAPALFHDEEKPARQSAVMPAGRSDEAKAKDVSKRNGEGWPVCSFRDALDAMGNVVKTKASFAGYEQAPFIVTTRPTEYQSYLFDLLGVKL